MIEYACAGLEAIYLPGYRYQKAGVIMLGLLPANILQGHLFVAPPAVEYDRFNPAQAYLIRIGVVLLA